MRGYQPSPYQHFLDHGIAEGRKIRLSKQIIAAKAGKIARIKKLISRHKPYSIVDNITGPTLCFLDDEIKARYGVEDTDNVSGHRYDPTMLALVEEYKDGLVLDCGRGKKPFYFENVINYEIVNYDTTDVIGVAEELPFVDNAFDAVISVAVLSMCETRSVRPRKSLGS